jgi:hypothetical protein
MGNRDPETIRQHIEALLDWLKERKLTRSEAVPIFGTLMGWGIAEEANGTPDAHFDEGLAIGQRIYEHTARELREKMKQGLSS